MRPIESTEWDLQFAAALSPWWLLLLAPLAALAGYALYRIQLKAVSKGSAAALVALRLALLASLVFLAFRPSIILRKILTYPGRILLVLDDSESMAASDTSLADEEALYLSRRLGNRSRDQSETCHQLAEIVWDLEALVRKFEVYQRVADRREDAFWDEAGRRQDTILERLRQFEEAAGSAPPLGPEGNKRLGEITDQISGLRTRLPIFFSGEKSPSPHVFDDFCGAAEMAVGQLLELQATADRAAIAQGNASLQAACDAIRGRTRLKLLTQMLEQAMPGLPALAPGQTFLAARVLSADVRQLQTAPRLDALPGDTDLLGRLDALLKEKSEFPLTAIILFSDGRDLGGRSLANLAQDFARKEVPVHAAAIGSIREPNDIALLGVSASPFAAKGSPLRVNVRVKSVVDKPFQGQLQILQAGQAVASTQAFLGDKEEKSVSISFTPQDSGLFRYTARFASAPGEVFPVQNNDADFAVHVREDKVRVLLLDWKPRWETRFALNILERMESVELNPIIVTVQEKATLARGARKGAWPDNPAALEIYDLVVLGDLPHDLLTESEWKDLQDFVLEKDKTLCFIGSGSRDPLPPLPSMSGSLLPVRPRQGPDRTHGELARAEQVLITETGKFHPVTRLFARGLEPIVESETPRLLPETQVLLAFKESGEPLVSCAFAGKGKTLFIDSDKLWKAFHPSLLAAHAQMVVGLVSWAIEGGYSPTAAESGAPRLALDGRSLAHPQGVQVWISPFEAGVLIEAVADGVVLAESEAAAPRGNEAQGRAVFTNLPGKDILFRLKNRPAAAAGPLMVVRDYPELHHVAQDADFLKELSGSTGGTYREFVDFEKFFLDLAPRERVEKHESIWRLWDSWSILALLMTVLTLEWVWRKFVGLV